MLKPLKASGSMFTNFTSPKGTKPPTLASDAIPSLVAGMDISEWDTVDVTAPPGPLGILLDGNYSDGAVLEGFAQIANDGTKGAVELDGRVVPSSVLVRVNDMDLLEHKLTLQEVGRVLRDTSHQVRMLSFRVPPIHSLEASGVAPSSPTKSAVSEMDERVLLKGMDKSSYKEKGGDKRSWNFKSMLSPSQIAGSVMAMSGFGASAQPETARETPTNSNQATEDAPKPVGYEAHESPVAAGGLRSPKLTSSPRSLQTTNKLAAKIPPGPIGLNLDGDIPDRAVVVGFLPVADGCIGELERRGDIPRGSVLVAINGSSVTHLTLDEVRARLGALAGFERELVFELPPSEDDGTPRVLTAKERAAVFDRLGDLDKRRKAELAHVLKHDSKRIKRQECWFLIATNWMMKWIEFTAKGGVSPGPITNYVLLEKNWKERVSGLAPGRPDAARAGLELMKDYRCVTPMVWALFAEWYGDSVPPPGDAVDIPVSVQARRSSAIAIPARANAIPIPVQARYVLDAYAEPLTDVDVTSILQQPRLQAATIANEMRERFPTAY